ncbi:MAG: DUF2157 domain-containing protein [Pirellulaceae bacterium]|nr:DUF2157 domain-containing protein [Pirellulaceae bacterium]
MFGLPAVRAGELWYDQVAMIRWCDDSLLAAWSGDCHDTITWSLAGQTVLARPRLTARSHLMDTDPTRLAQRRADRIACFRAELAELERDQVLTLTAQQRLRLDAHLEGVLSSLREQFGVDATDSARRIAWGMRIASLLGGVALGCAVVLFLHRYWGSLPPVGQVVALVAAPVVLLAVAELLSRRRVDRYYTALFGLAATAAFVVELNALGSVVNAAPSPHALLAWGVFSILVAYAYGLRLLLSIGLVLTSVYTAAVWMAARGEFWGAFLERSELLIPAAAILYVVPDVVRLRDTRDFHFVYRCCGAALGLVSLLVFSTSGHLCCWGVTYRVAQVICQIAGMALSVAVIVHGFRLGRGGLVNLGALAFVLFLYVRLHSWWWHWMPKYLFFFLIGLVAIALLLVFRRVRARLASRGTS